jgi:hypothetical protein
VVPYAGWYETNLLRCLTLWVDGADKGLDTWAGRESNLGHAPADEAQAPPEAAHSVTLRELPRFITTALALALLSSCSVRPDHCTGFVVGKTTRDEAPNTCGPPMSISNGPGQSGALTYDHQNDLMNDSHAINVFTFDQRGILIGSTR